MKISFQEIQREYRLPMGIFFRLTNKDAQYVDMWLVTSNLPELNLKTYSTLTEEETVNQIYDLIKKNFCG